MAVVRDYRTASGIILPPEVGFKMDRSQGLAVRNMPGSGSMGVSRFKQYSDYLTAIRVPWVHRCVLTIASNFANTEWDLMEEDEVIEDEFDQFLQLMERPNPVQDGFAFRELFQMYFELLGEAFITLEARDGLGRPRELYLPNPANMVVVPDPNSYIKGYIYTVGSGAQKIPYTPDEVIHIKQPNPMNQYRGFGTVEANQVILDIVEAMNNHERSYYESGGRIVGVLETDGEVGDDDFDKLMHQWQEFSRDQRSRFKTAILQAGLKYTPIAEGMRNLNLVEMNKEKRDTILGAWGVPKQKVGIMEDAQFNLDAADRTFEEETMDPKLTRWEHGIQGLIDLFNPNRRWQFERKNFQDDATKLLNAQKMSTTYAFTVNQILDYCGFPKVKGGDVIMVPGQMIPTPLDQLGDVAAANADQTINPPEPPAPAPPRAPEPSGTGGSGSPGGNGAVPPKPGQSPAKVVPLPRKVAFATPEQKEQMLLDATKAAQLAPYVQHRFARRPKDRAADTKAMRAIRSGTPAIAAAKLRMQGRFIQQAKAQVGPRLRSAFRAQRERVVSALPQLVKGNQGAKLNEKQKATLRTAIGALLDPRPLEAALNPLHVSGLAQGFNAGERLVVGSHATILRGKLQARKDAGAFDTKQVAYLPPDAPGWRQMQEQWRQDMPLLSAGFDDLATSVTGINETTAQQLADTIATGLTRGYTPLQIAEGVGDENYGGVASVMDDAADWRTEAIARTEARMAFERGSLAAYAMAEIPQVEAVDGETFDEACRNRNGEVFDMDPVSGLPDAPEADLEEHTNGTLTWVPAAGRIVDTTDYLAGTELAAGEAAARVPGFKYLQRPARKEAAAAPTPISVHVPANPVHVDVHVPAQESRVDVHVPEQVPPAVHVAAPQVDVHVPEQAAPQVHVDVDVPTPKVDVQVAAPQVDVHVPEQSPPSVTVMPSKVEPQVHVDVHNDIPGPGEIEIIRDEQDRVKGARPKGKK